MTKFKHIVSLGFFCSVASELDRFEFRDASYPFDWVIIDLHDVVALIETRFSNFLNVTESSRHEDYPSIVKCPSGADFYHDFPAECLVGNILDEVKAKYKRRIDRFYNAIKRPTLFLRYVRNSAEAQWYVENRDYVLSVLKRENQYNELVFIAHAESATILNSVNEVCFRVKPDFEDIVARSFFKDNLNIQKYLRKRYSHVSYFRNVRHSRMKNRKNGQL